MSSNHPAKKGLHITLTFDIDKVRTGFLFIQSDERLVDLMNDDRQFLPFEDDDGNFLIIRKSAISEISILHEGMTSRLSLK